MLRPLNDRIIGIIKSQEDTKPKSLILLKEENDQTSRFVEVVAVGPGRYYDGKLLPLNIKVGDTVIIPNYSGAIVITDGVEHVIFQEKNVLAVQ